MRRIAVALFTVTLITCPSALADTEVVRDPKDLRGRLDIKVLRHSHGSSRDRLQHTIRMHGNWRGRALRRNHRAIGIYFDINRRRERREIWIKYRRGELRAYMVVLKFTRGGKVGDVHRAGAVRVVRTSRRAVRVAFDAKRLNHRGGGYRWSAVLALDLVCIPESCDSDHAPDQGMIRHVL